jgi:hypothetical protein
MNFLYIFEDGSIRIGKKPADADIESVEDGVLSIVNMRTKEEYVPGQGWEKIEEIETEDEDEEVDFDEDDFDEDED